MRITGVLRLLTCLSLVPMLSACPKKEPKAPPTIVSFTASAASVPYGGGDVTLSWVQADAVSLDITGIGNVTGRTSALVNVKRTTTFTLTATNKKGSTQSYVTIEVRDPLGPPVITGFTANPGNLPLGGGEVTLLFSADDAQTLFVDSGVGNVTGKSQATKRITETTTFTLTATNVKGTVTATTTVTVYVPTAPPQIASFSASPSSLGIFGGQATLAWNVNDASALSIDNGVGTVSGTSTKVNVTQTTTFRLTATNVRGATVADTTVTVYVPAAPPVVNAFTASPASLGILGGASTLSWNVVDASSVSIEPSVGNVTGKTTAAVSVTQTTTFRLTASNVRGSVIAETTVTVYVPSTPPTVNSFTSNPTNLPMGGGQASLTWNVTDATAITIDNGVGSVTGRTWANVNLTQTTTFTLTATNLRGSVTAQTTVTVYVPSTPPRITGFSASPASLGLFGGETTLTWNTIEATGLSIDKGVGNVTGRSSAKVTVRETTTFRLTATNVRGPSVADTTVTVYVPNAAPTISSFTATPQTLPEGGGNVTLNWLVTDATAMTIDNGVGDVLNRSSASVRVTSTTAFKMVASNVKGTSQAIVLITVNNPTTTPAIRSFTATPTRVPAEGGYVTLNWNLQGASSSSIDQGVGSVQGQSTRQVFVSSTRTFTLTATNTVGSSYASLTVTRDEPGTGGGGSGTITGRVLYSGVLAPVRSAEVNVLGYGSAITDTDGNFSISSVPSTYDIAVNASTNNITVYKGLTRTNPTLVIYDSLPASKSIGVFYGALSNSNGTTPSNAIVVFGGPNFEANGVSASSSTYSFESGLKWYGNDARGNFYAFQGFGTSSPRVARSSDYNLVTESYAPSLSMSLASAARLSGSCTRPSTSYTISTKEAGIKLSARTGIYIPDNSPSTAFDLYATTVTGGDTYVSCEATTGFATSYARRGGLTGSTSSISLELPEAQRLSSPSDSATSVGAGTTFSWNGTSGLHLVHLQPRSGATGPRIHVVTREQSVRLPSLSQADVTLPSYGSYLWWVESFPGYTTVNDATNGSTLLDLLVGKGTFTRTETGSRYLTTGD
jgi:hypothetical protein